MDGTPCLILLDNGSLEAAATLSLRGLAAELSLRLGREVRPVSLLHSHKVPPELLEGRPADILEPFLRRQLNAGQNEFLIIPLFFGPSSALVDYIPARLAVLREKFPSMKVTLAPCLVDESASEDEAMASILEENILATLPVDQLSPAERNSRPCVILVDHGSPRREVTAVREHLATQLRPRLGSRILKLITASMERRPEPEFDFNEPLLERALVLAAKEAVPVIIALLFVSPGRHAGPGGDIEQICQQAQSKHPALSYQLTGLVGQHRGLVEILAERAIQSQSKKS